VRISGGGPCCQVCCQARAGASSSERVRVRDHIVPGCPGTLGRGAGRGARGAGRGARGAELGLLQDAAAAAAAVAALPMNMTAEAAVNATAAAGGGALNATDDSASAVATPVTPPEVTAQQATPTPSVPQAPPGPVDPYQNSDGAWVYTDAALTSGAGGPPKGLLSEILQNFAYNLNSTGKTAPAGGTMVINSPVDPASLFTPAQLLPLYVGQPGAGGYGSL